MAVNPGSVVQCRNRHWVLLPSENDDFWALRPLAGTEEDVVNIHKQLSQLLGYELPWERVQPAAFPLPTPEDVSDASGAHLLWHAARLTLREGATPFRSLGRISIRPRTYQFVPLLMALRLDPVRLFIADDVGVGKTIEALLIARELWDRGEIRRFTVLCPPYLCDQWAAELAQKCNLEPVVIRSGTISQLERMVPHGESVYQRFPIHVASIDFVKTERNRHHFLQFCPELVIVDEAHGAAQSNVQAHQERHTLLQDIAKDPRRHVILLTATPHSGIEGAFRSLLALLRPEFSQWDLSSLDEEQRKVLALHFVQRTRADIVNLWEKETPFPDRIQEDRTYELSPRYRQLFQRTYSFCRDIVRTGGELDTPRQRVRYWGALALLRCVMSSPAAAVSALANRGAFELDAEQAPDFPQFVFESEEDRTDDEAPTPPIQAAEQTLPDLGRRQLRELAQLAEALRGPEEDSKLERAIRIVADLLREGFSPIVWCRYVATAEYVAEHLEARLPNVHVVCVTGRLGEEERQAKIESIEADHPRVLVATDCLSEGVNLQEKFTAVVHYDLPWNPNRLEQREGRVDRFGQTAKKVKAVRFFGRNNPIDGVVIDVLLRKADEIHRTLGTHVPVPEESEDVVEALLNALFFRVQQHEPDIQQLRLFEDETVTRLHDSWNRRAERERISRTRFAQRALKPEEVQRELEATDAVLGDPEAVRQFVLTAAQRVGLTLQKDPRREGVWRIDLDPEALVTVPDPVRLALPRHERSGSRAAPKTWLVSFDSPTPEGSEYLGRNHRFVAALARFILERALTEPGNEVASRCGVIRTQAVTELTSVLLLRVRYLLQQPPGQLLLAEEVSVLGFAGLGSSARRLSPDQALGLLTARPDANVPLPEKQELLTRTLAELAFWQRGDGRWGAGHPWGEALRQAIETRAEELEQAHKRIRQAVSERVRGLQLLPQFPPDLLGVLILQPVVRR